MRKIGIFLLLMIGNISIIFAAYKQQSINYSSGLGTPIITTNTDTMDKGTWNIGDRIEYWRSKPLSDAVLIQYPLTESYTGGFVNYLSLDYGLTDSLTVGTNVPYSYATNFKAANWEINAFNSARLGNISGWGDTNFYALWRVLDNDKHPASIALLVGLNSPTGKTSVLTQQGQLFAAADQPGSGAWAPLAGLIFSRQYHEQLELSANIIYTQGTTGTQNTRLGSILEFDVAGVYELYKDKRDKINFNLIAELNGEYTTKDKIDGYNDNFSGGTTLFGTLGARANWDNGTSLYLALALPLIQNYNGVQPKGTYGVVTGIDVAI